MSASPELSADRKLSGTTRIFLAFVMGTLFALLPLYYLYSRRDAVVRGASPVDPPPITADPARGAPSGAAATRFAARMTYELSHTPAEPVRVTAAAPVAESRSAATAETPAARVHNAKPIIAAPPD